MDPSVVHIDRDGGRGVERPRMWALSLEVEQRSVSGIVKSHPRTSILREEEIEAVKPSKLVA